jgi:hypothetical protein
VSLPRSMAAAPRPLFVPAHYDASGALAICRRSDTNGHDLPS